MSNVARTIEGVKGSVPQHAEPVARELAALVATANTKCAKYAARNACSSMFHLRSEAVRLNKPLPFTDVCKCLTSMQHADDHCDSGC